MFIMQTPQRHVPAVHVRDLTPLPLAAGATLSVPLQTELQCRVGEAIIQQTSRQASKVTAQFLSNSNICAAFRDAATAAQAGTASPPASLVDMVGDRGCAQRIQNSIVAAVSSKTLATQGGQIRAAVDELVGGPGFAALKHSFGTVYGHDHVTQLSIAGPLRAVCSHFAAKLDIGDQPSFERWTKNQGRIVAEQEFLVGAKYVLTELLTKEILVDPLSIKTTNPGWYKQVKVEQIFDRAMSQSQGTKVNDGMPVKLATEGVTESEARRNRSIAAALFGSLGLTCWSLAPITGGFSHAAGFVASGIALLCSLSRSESYKFGSVFSVSDFCAAWDRCSGGQSCAGTIRGLAAAFQSIRGDDMREIGTADEKMLRAIYEAIIKVEQVRKSSVASSTTQQPDSKDASITKEQWGLERKAINDATVSVAALPGLMLSTAMPIAVSFPFWKPIVFKWFGW